MPGFDELMIVYLVCYLCTGNTGMQYGPAKKGNEEFGIAVLIERYYL